MIEDLVQHLANLTFLLDYYDKHGATRNRWVIAEFEAGNKRLLAALKEKHSETGKSEYRPFGGDEAGAELPRGEPRRGGSAGPEGGTGASGGTALRRPRLAGPDGLGDNSQER